MMQTTLHNFFIPHIANRAAWTLVHFLWQGALIAAITAGLLRILSRRDAQLRYVVAVMALITMVLMPAATFAFYTRAGSMLRGAMLRIATAIDPAALTRAASTAILSNHNSKWTTWIVYMWVAGVALSSLRILVGWRLTRRLLRTASDAVPDFIKQTFDCMKERMSLTRPVKLLLSEHIDGPAAIGWLKPVVLLPFTTITGLDPEQLEAVLAHELAHIRRHDFLVNVLQQCVESLLFYHPAVWWLSRRIRIEREHVCDDLAVAACGDPAMYAKALVELERSRSNIPEIAMAAARGSLKARVRRIFGWMPEGRDWREATMAAMFILTVLVAAAWQTRTIEAQSAGVHVAQFPSSSIARVEAPSAPGPATLLAATLASLAPSPEAAVGPGAAQNSSPTAKSSIQGMVLSAATGEPIADAQLTILPAAIVADYTRLTEQIILDEKAFAEGYRAGTQISARNPLATTDAQGRFTIENLDAGSYRLSVVAGGFVRQEYGQRFPEASGSLITTSAGQATKDIVIRMTPTATISGIVRNGRGKPAIDVPVQLLKASFNFMGQRVTQVVASSRTDDRGEYRLYWIAPGHYFLSAGTSPAPGARGAATVTSRPSSDSAPTVAYPIAFFPGVQEMSAASIIDVLPDTPVTADISVSEQSMFKVSGRVLDVTGKPAASAQLSLVYQNPTGSSDSITGGSTYNAATGDFEFRNVAPGSYYVQAVTVQVSGSTPLPDAAQIAKTFFTFSTSAFANPAGAYIATVAGRGSTPITVTNTNIANVVVTMSPTSSIKGRLTVDGQPQPAGIPSLRVQFRRSAGSTPFTDTVQPTAAAVAADGTFQFNGVAPDEYRVALASLPVKYYIKEVKYGATDALNDPIQFSTGASESIEIVLSLRVAQVDGTVTDDKGQPVPGIQAVLVPDAHRDRSELFRTASTDRNGRFTISGVPPGDYKVFAWESIESYGYFDPELLKRDEAKGQRIKIQESDKATVAVKMIPGDSQ
jgi:beta-lactamase regulating signal transducer with metallopeptidase domain/protocatechuate 3,4-dioxygenase beta subunit